MFIEENGQFKTKYLLWPLTSWPFPACVCVCCKWKWGHFNVCLPIDYFR